MAFTHPIAAVMLAAPFYRREIPARVWIWGALLTALPDIDFIGYRLGAPYEHLWGHRGLTHSLVFAAVVGGMAAWWMRRDGKCGKLWLFFFLCTASHGLLDGMTDGGLGVAYFSPFDDGRYFLPFRPIPVAPLSPARIFSEWGWRVIKAELLWLWIPALVATVAILAARWPAVRSGSGR